ncbi:autophagocytosis associated protein, active-site domain-containing protein [Hirsutella rhossiliensis]|uniref:Ubiquitin-like-conjugating enzyme ATG10 n=1 Tax=Hirsutella rhossiliensis TaxID=111463 RepID=A0A9P8N5W9_9HYPO|nr:autophagocytosis associated protein, active-site domain-containing protein [Hirsutella rhossiliensis]KAH0967177.1 autophagocytosis associated protein, active-site domain-containing protein [Hirsutella rhossiliensis]
MDTNLKDFPFLDREEFSGACHHLDRQYCQATLGPLRRRWKLRLCTALDTVFDVDGGYTTYIQVTRPLEPTVDHGNLSLDMGRISISQDATVKADQDMMDAEELDSAAIIKHAPGRDEEHVAYEIHLHPTYRVPCLWFTLHNLPADEPAFSIDTVFRRLVPDEYKDGLRGLGGIGGISADHHPVTGVPAFFVHPCLVGDALSRFECSRENYLIIWLGLVGGCVGLWVPKEMVVQ